MKIDNNFKATGTGSTSSRPRSERAEKSGENAVTEVRLSATSAHLASAGSSGAPVDGARIAEIKLAISEGRFQVNAEAIADGLINTARDLLRSQRKG